MIWVFQNGIVCFFQQRLDIKAILFHIFSSILFFVEMTFKQPAGLRILYSAPGVSVNYVIIQIS